MAVFAENPITADNEKGGTYLTITILENLRRVRSLNLPELGKSVMFAPLTKTEREALAKGGQTKAVPMVTAKR